MGNSHKILVVDDEVPVVQIIKANLQLEGYEVVAAYDGVEALEKVKTEKPHLLILDVMMPRMDGWEVLLHLKNDSSTQMIPVIMLTALSQVQDVARGWDEGVDCYLSKPFEPLELMAVVKRLLMAVDEQAMTHPGAGSSL